MVVPTTAKSFVPLAYLLLHQPLLPLFSHSSASFFIVCSFLQLSNSLHNNLQLTWLLYILMHWAKSMKFGRQTLYVWIAQTHNVGKICQNLKTLNALMTMYHSSSSVFMPNNTPSGTKLPNKKVTK